MRVVITDGGRAAAGYKSATLGDCVARSIAIASWRPYSEVYDALAHINAVMPKTTRRMVRGKHLGQVTASHGIYVQSQYFKNYMKKLGFVWTPTMHIGSGCTVHLADGELPMGRLVVSVSKHYTAVIDGVIHDAVIDGVIHDIHGPSPNGTRCVYGYWRKA